MFISKSIETPDGTVEFTANLQKDELDFIIEVGLNVILASGATTFLSDKSDKLDSLITSSEATN